MRHGTGRQARARSAGRRPGRARAPVYGAVDLGTSNCRMLMAKPAGGDFRVVGSFSRIVRLGEGLAASGRLSDAAIARTVEALKVCAEKMRAHGVRQVRGVATEACRRAGNCAEFLHRVKAETGLALESISPAEEAKLTLAGCAPLLDAACPRALVFDIGGGSTELMWIGLAAGRAPRLLGLLSLKHGVVTLAERHGRDAIPPKDYKRIVAGIKAELASFDAEHGIAREIARGGVQMLGTSGTVTTFGGIYLGLPRYDRSRVDGLVIDFDSIAAISARLSGMDYKARSTYPCIRRDGADLMVMGCAILDAICRRWPVGRLRIADRGIREGLLLGMMAADGSVQAPVPPSAPRAAGHAPPRP
ncbi:MAG: Ppx/GppA family phosphatase [Proteobacteria bacterium]|nr:Ppx/GppA family phosphatase [Pseudomonadota bacterium]